MLIGKWVCLKKSGNIRGWKRNIKEELHIEHVIHILLSVLLIIIYYKISCKSAFYPSCKLFGLIS